MKITDSKSLGSALRKRRKELGYTQRDLSEFTGLSISFLSDLERGKKTIELEKALFVTSILGLNLTLEPRN
jgi:y4mF family transcriptional regulator